MRATVGRGVVCWLKRRELMVGDKGAEFANESGRGRELVSAAGRSELEDRRDIDPPSSDPPPSMKVSALAASTS